MHTANTHIGHAIWTIYIENKFCWFSHLKKMIVTFQQLRLFCSTWIMITLHMKKTKVEGTRLKEERIKNSLLTLERNDIVLPPLCRQEFFLFLFPKMGTIRISVPLAMAGVRH